jgi:WhiB family transcriptional regulator, redox-sensing transcriptional regulator
MTKADADWRGRGACLSADPELFFPLSSAGPSVEQLHQAKTVCAGCQVRAECLEFALATRQVHGVWGGTSEDERQQFLAGRTSRPAPAMASQL